MQFVFVLNIGILRSFKDSLDSCHSCSSKKAALCVYLLIRAIRAIRVRFNIGIPRSSKYSCNSCNSCSFSIPRSFNYSCYSCNSCSFKNPAFCVYLLIRVISEIRVHLKKTIFRVLIKTYVRLTLNNPCESCFPTLNLKIYIFPQKICLFQIFVVPLHPYSTFFLSTLRVFHPRVEVVIRWTIPF